MKSYESWTGEGLLSILGPTGSGKTQAALEIAQKLKTRNPILVSLDSVAIYEGLDIGSAKPSVEELKNFEWLGINLIKIDQKISAPEFCRRIQSGITTALSQNRPVVCVGGSHFYEKAFIEGSKPGGPTPTEEVDKLKLVANDSLWEKLCTCDKRWADKVNINDRYRLVRFFDLVVRQNFSYDDLMGNDKTMHYLPANTHIFRCALGMQRERSEFQEFLKSRIEKMWKSGWVAEIKRLLDQGFSKESPGLQSVGYREVLQFISGEMSESQTLEKILISHMQLAKKQRTWIRGLTKN